MLIKVLQVPDKVKKLVLGWLSHIVFLHFSNEVEQPDQQNQTRPRKQSKVKGSTSSVRFPPPLQNGLTGQQNYIFSTEPQSEVLLNYPFSAQSVNGAFHSNGGDVDRALNHLDPGMLRFLASPQPILGEKLQ